MAYTFRLTTFTLFCTLSFVAHAQPPCSARGFIINTSLNISGFGVQNHPNDQIDSLLWNFGDGQTELQTVNIGTGSAVHTYAAPGTYTVTLEQWGVEDYPLNPTPFHCVYSLTNEVYDVFTDSLCGGDFLVTISGDHVTFTNRSVIHAPSFNSHSTQPLWVFGNGQIGIQINTIYEVIYAPGTYTACLYYGGFSFLNNGYLYDCETCQTFTITGPQGLAERSIQELELYPNPSAEWIELRSTKPLNGASATIFDLTGKMVDERAHRPEDGHFRIDVRDLEPGAYHIRLSGTRSDRTVRFIKLSSSHGPTDRSFRCGQILPPARSAVLRWMLHT